jgi:cob(I)alamin adenosyltransferase
MIILAKPTKWLGFFSIFNLFFSAALLSAPIKTPCSLPLSGNDILAAASILQDDKLNRDFIYFIKNLDVFADHQNTKEVEQIENKKISKYYYIAPFFQASEERAYAGTQELAEEAIKIIGEIYEMVSAFDYELFKINQVSQEIDKKIAAIKNLKKKISNSDELSSKKITEELVVQLEKEVSKLNTDLGILENNANQGIDETSTLLKRQVISQIQLKLSFLGVTATSTESELLKSNKASDLRIGIASLISRTTGQGQFGYRTVAFESGFTEQQRKWIGLYRSIRPDVHVSSLPTKTVYARSTALTARENGGEIADYFTGSDRTVNAPRLFLAVNGGSNGACGNTKSCNVTIEFTWLGATLAKSARSGAIILPIFFEADVLVAQPDFEGSVTCDFKNGFSVTGRADVKDGAVIYDGDIHNKINYEALEEGSCNYKIDKGDADSAAYHTIKYIHDNYLKLKMQRASKSRDEMNEYKNSITNELKSHAVNSQNKNYDSWSITSWSQALGNAWGNVATIVVEGIRSFYWHTRIEDSSIKEIVKFTTKISESNVQKIERMSFDGFPIMCWKGNNATLDLVACPTSNISNYIKQSDTDLGKNRSLCGEDGVSTNCLDMSEYVPDTDNNGIISDPWA